MEPVVVYDGQCPFCRAYVASLEGKVLECEAGSEDKAKQGGLNKVDARCSPELVEQLLAANIDINAGIALIKNEQVYQGAEALSLLAREHAAPGLMAGAHHRLLRFRLASRLLYPALRLLRNSYLRLVGLAPIEPEPKVKASKK